MAKRPLARETLTLAGDINAKSAFPRGKSLVFRTTDSDWDGNMPSEYAAYAKLRSALSGSYDMWLCASDRRFWFARAGDDAIPAREIWYELARCIAPEMHELPLADSINRLGTAAYWKNAFNEVTVVFDYGEKSNDNFVPDQWTLIATLPEGFRPVLQSQWGMCSDSGSDNVVATYRLDYDGSLYYRASTAAVNKKSLGGIRFVFIARN